MKIELDFDSKIITLKSEVNIKELHDAIEENAINKLIGKWPK